MREARGTIERAVLSNDEGRVTRREALRSFA
jgi:hypothetical protein